MELTIDTYMGSVGMTPDELAEWIAVNRKIKIPGALSAARKGPIKATPGVHSLRFMSGEASGGRVRLESSGRVLAGSRVGRGRVAGFRAYVSGPGSVARRVQSG